MNQIHKEVYGQGKTIVLIHGWAMHTGIWRKFAKQLAKNYRVVCLDLPGHGLSKTVQPYCLESVAKALIDVVDEPTFAVLGWSLGASVAIALANQYPQRVKALILMAGNPRFTSDDGWSGVRPELLQDFAANLQNNCQATLMRFLALQVNSLPNAKGLLKELRQEILGCEVPGETVLNSALDILKTADLRDDLVSLECPVNIILGDKDALVPKQAGDDIQGIKPACELNIILGAGHVPFLSHQSEVIDTINRFL